MPVPDDINWLGFTGLHALMTESGYQFSIHRSNDGWENNESRAWLRNNNPGITGIVTTDEADPNLALRDLYKQCSEKWPQPSPFDGKSLELLIGECVERKWHPIIRDNTADHRIGKWCVYWDGTIQNSGAGVSLYAALKDAMTNRLKSEKGSQSPTTSPQETFDRHPHG